MGRKRKKEDKRLYLGCLSFSLRNKRIRISVKGKPLKCNCEMEQRIGNQERVWLRREPRYKKEGQWKRENAQRHPCFLPSAEQEGVF